MNRIKVWFRDSAHDLGIGDRDVLNSISISLSLLHPNIQLKPFINSVGDKRSTQPQILFTPRFLNRHKAMLRAFQKHRRVKRPVSSSDGIGRISDQILTVKRLTAGYSSSD